MTVVEKAIDKGLMTRMEEGILLLDPNPDDIILHEAPITSKTIRAIEMTVGSRYLEVPIDFLLGDPELHQDHPAEIKTDVNVGFSSCLSICYLVFSH